MIDCCRYHNTGGPATQPHGADCWLGPVPIAPDSAEKRMERLTAAVVELLTVVEAISLLLPQSSTIETAIETGRKALQ